MIDAKVYTRYVVRDRDGEVLQQGRIYPLRRALDLGLIGKDGSQVRYNNGSPIIGPYVFHPEIRDGTNFKVEIF